MEAIRTSFQTFSISLRLWFLKEPYNFELEIPQEILETDFTKESTAEMVSRNAETPNGTKFKIDDRVYVDADLVAVNIVRTVEMGDFSVAAFLQLGWTIRDCILEVVVLEKDFEDKDFEERGEPYSVYAEVWDHNSKPVLRRLASLFKHIELEFL